MGDLGVGEANHIGQTSVLPEEKDRNLYENLAERGEELLPFPARQG